jgi:large subunit ribosomal protein L13
MRSEKLEIKRSWHLVDVRDQVLGRTATKIARFLTGKDKVEYVPHLDLGDYVVVINAKEVAVTGKKEKQKIYYRHSGYPGGLRSEALGDLRKRRPEEIVRRAVKGMLPKNKLQKSMLKRLHVFAGEEHPFEDKFKRSPKGEVPPKLRRSVGG